MTAVRNPHLANILTEVGNSGNGTIVCITVRKKGVVRGKAGNKQTYGNDLVKVLVWTGFNNEALTERSLEKFHELWETSDSFIKDLTKEVRDAGFPDVTIKEVAEGASEVQQSLSKPILEEDFKDITPVMPKEEIWGPLIVDGVEVRGAKIYTGKANPENHRAPVPGTIYISGAKLGEVVIEAAPQWETKKKAKTVAKDLIRRQLPIGLYVNYCLGKDNYLGLTVGKAASADAKAAGVEVDTDLIRSLFIVGA